mgnify:CR=1 FL=1
MTVTKEKARKKTIAGLLALAMGASALPAAPVLAGEGGGAPAWTACAECSEESPHIITTKEELDAIRTIDKRRLREHMGHLDENQMAQVDDAIAVSFGLPGGGRAT